MISEELLQKFPSKRIKPFDGMAITAAVWEEAHEYQRLQGCFHGLFSHGSGILVGLEVIASDPPDTSVYVQPGVAVDPDGQVIVLPQPVAYDIGQEMEGQLYILLSYSESRPRREENGDQQDGPLYIHSEFSISARTSRPSGSWVELARVKRENRDSVFHNASNPLQPGLNEIDLRFRREVGAPPEVTMAICYQGQVENKKHGLGAAHMAQAVNHSGRHRVYVEDDVPLAPGVENNTLIYLVGQGSFELNQGQTNFLYNYVQKGRGTLLIESLDSKAEETFLNILKKIKLEVEPISAGYRLLLEPYLFAAPPPGFDPDNYGDLLVNEGIIFSTNNYGYLWAGDLQNGLPSREQIRTAIEWGANIVTYALNRRRQAG